MLRVAQLEKAFDFYNLQLFGGRLTRPRFMVRKMKHDLARYYEPEPGHPAGLIVMNSARRHPWTWRSTLVHELLHISVGLGGNDVHGADFTAEANRVGALMGLEPCELEESWCWPHHHIDGEPEDGEVSGNMMDD